MIFDFDDTDSIFCLPIFIVRCFDGYILEKSHLKKKCRVNFFEKSNILLLIFSLHAHWSQAAAGQIKSSQAQWGHTIVEVAFPIQKIFPMTDLSNNSQCGNKISQKN